MKLGLEFTSFLEFERVFQEWCEEKYYPMRIGTSHRIPNSVDPHCPYISVTYRCKHSGIPRYRGALKRPNQKYFAQNCLAMLKIAYYSVQHVYKVTKFCDEHNHPVGESYYHLYPEKRRLSKEELLDVKDLFNFKIGSRQLAQLIHEKTGKQLTSHDISNIRHRYKLNKPIVMPKNFDNHIESSELISLQKPGIDLHIETNSENNDWEFLILQTSVMKDLITRHSQMLFFIKRDDTNQERLPLYVVLCKTADNHICPTGFIFTHGDNHSLLQTALSKFSFLNPQLTECAWFLTTKELYESHVLQMMFSNANIFLCPWHMMSHIREQLSNYKMQPTKKTQLSSSIKKLQQAVTVDDYNQCMQHLKTIMPSNLFEDIIISWESIRTAWAAAFCPDMLSLGSYQMTGFYQKLKRFTKPTFKFMETVKSLIDLCKQNDVVLAHVSFKKLKSESQDKKMDLFQQSVLELCIDEAVNLIQDQINLYFNGKWKIDVTQSHVTNLMTEENFLIGIDKLSCSCTFQKLHQLPCCHLIVFRDTLQMELNPQNLIHAKWTKTFADTDVDNCDNLSEVPSLTVNSECSGVVANTGCTLSSSNDSSSNQLEKFCDAQVVTNKIALFLSKSSASDFNSKLECLKNLLKSWEKPDQIILCTVKSTEIPTSMIDDHCYLLSDSIPLKQTVIVDDHGPPGIELACPELDTFEEEVET